MKYWNQFKNTNIFWSISILSTFLLSNLVVSYFGLRLDCTGSKRFTLTESTKQVLGNLGETLYIDAYYSSAVPGEYKSRLNITKELLKEIARVGGKNVVFRMHDPDSSETARSRAKEIGIEPQTLQKVERGSSQLKEAFFGVSLSLGSKLEILPVVFFADTLEYQLLSTLKKMTGKNSSSGVAILQGEGASEFPPPGEKTGKDTFGVFVHQAFQNENGSVQPLNLDSENIPSEIHTIMIVGSPVLSPKSKFKLDQFLLSKGNIIFFAKSMDFQIQPTRGFMGMSMGQSGIAQPVPWIADTNSFLENYGVRVQPDLVSDKVNSMPMGALIEVEEGTFGRVHYPYWLLLSKEKGNFNPESAYTQGLNNLVVPWSSGLEIVNASQPNLKKEILFSSSKTSGRKKDFVLVGETQAFKSKLDSEGTEIPLAVSLEGNFTSFFAGKDLQSSGVGIAEFSKRKLEGEGKLLVFGSPYLISDLLAVREFREIYQEANLPFLFNVLDIVKGDKDLLKARSKKDSIRVLKPFSDTTKSFFNFFNIGFLPILIGIVSYIHLKKRRERK